MVTFGSTVTRPLTRAELSSLTQEVGEAVNRLRTSLLDAKMPFTSGVIRGAEESILVVKTMLDDAAVQDAEL
jgi:hypothetical protein